MALATTTLSSACTATDRQIVVASATSVAAGRIIRIDGEWMQVTQDYVSGTTVGVLRGRDGSAAVAHAASSNVTHGVASDFATPPVGVSESVTAPIQPALPLYSYSASGAITPSQGIHIINGTSTLAMTLASPTKDQDGQVIIVVGNGKSQSTVTYSAGFGNAGSSYDVLTAQNAGQVGFIAVAANGIWVLLNAPITGTTTALSWAIA